MKIETKMVENKTYICDNCGSKHGFQGSILKCDCCGKEICDDCGFEKQLYGVARYFESLSYECSEHLHLCKECLIKVSDKYGKYKKAWDKKEEELVKKLNKVTDDFLKDIGAENE